MEEKHLGLIEGVQELTAILSIQRYRTRDLIKYIGEPIKVKQQRSKVLPRNILFKEIKLFNDPSTAIVASLTVVFKENVPIDLLCRAFDSYSVEYDTRQGATVLVFVDKKSTDIFKMINTGFLGTYAEKKDGWYKEGKDKKMEKVDIPHVKSLNYFIKGTDKPLPDDDNVILLKQNTVTMIEGTRFGTGNYFERDYIVADGSTQNGLSAKIFFPNNDTVIVGLGTAFQVNEKIFEVIEIGSRYKNKPGGYVKVREMI